MSFLPLGIWVLVPFLSSSLLFRGQALKALQRQHMTHSSQTRRALKYPKLHSPDSPRLPVPVLAFQSLEASGCCTCHTRLNCQVPIYPAQHHTSLKYQSLLLVLAMPVRNICLIKLNQSTTISTTLCASQAALCGKGTASSAIFMGSCPHISPGDVAKALPDTHCLTPELPGS